MKLKFEGRVRVPLFFWQQPSSGCFLRGFWGHVVWEGGRACVIWGQGGLPLVGR